MGTSVPTINNFRALPTPGNAIWPQFLLDIDYQGAQLTQAPADHSQIPKSGVAVPHIESTRQLRPLARSVSAFCAPEQDNATTPAFVKPDPGVSVQARRG